jgi:hypothetical protein
MDDLIYRFTHDLIGRIGGPLSFRLILQPLMSTFFAVRDGLRDAKTGQQPYFWSLFTDRPDLREHLREGWKSIGKIFILAVILDVIYQIIALHRFYPGEDFTTAILLAIIPYLLLRGLVNRIARRWRERVPASHSTTH